MYQTKNSLNYIKYLKYLKYPIIAFFISVLYFFLIKEYTHSKKITNFKYSNISTIINNLYYQSLKNINVYFRESFTRNDIIGILLIIIGIIIVGK